MQTAFTILDCTTPHEIRATLRGDRVLVDPASVRAVLGWKLEPSGLCREDVCLIVPDRDALVQAEGLDLACLAELLGRPLALDRGERIAALGTPHASRASQMARLEAPDFELPDLLGHLHKLSDHRGKKVLLIAYASW